MRFPLSHFSGSSHWHLKRFFARRVSNMNLFVCGMLSAVGTLGWQFCFAPHPALSPQRGAREETGFEHRPGGAISPGGPAP